MCGYGVPLRMQAKLRAVVSGGDGVRVLCNALGLSAHHGADHGATLILASPDEEVSSRSSWLGDHARCSRRAAGYRNSARAKKSGLSFSSRAPRPSGCPVARHLPAATVALEYSEAFLTLAGRGYHSRPRGDVNQHTKAFWSEVAGGGERRRHRRRRGALSEKELNLHGQNGDEGRRARDRDHGAGSNVEGVLC